jgi:predicted helicase
VLLADSHLGYEQAKLYDLTLIENDKIQMTWYVEKMKLSPDGTSIIVNKWLTLGGVPSEALDYQLGNKSALEWVVEQYQVRKDKAGNVIWDPNRADDPQYIVKHLQRVITVSLETVKIVKGLPEDFGA